MLLLNAMFTFTKLTWIGKRETTYVVHHKMWPFYLFNIRKSLRFSSRHKVNLCSFQLTITNAANVTYFPTAMICVHCCLLNARTSWVLGFGSCCRWKCLCWEKLETVFRRLNICATCLLLTQSLYLCNFFRSSLIFSFHDVNSSSELRDRIAAGWSYITLAVFLTLTLPGVSPRRRAVIRNRLHLPSFFSRVHLL